MAVMPLAATLKAPSYRYTVLFCPNIQTPKEPALLAMAVDKKDSVMFRIHEMLGAKLGDIKEAIGVTKGAQQEAKRGHMKGNSFQEDLYLRLAEWGKQQGDETEFVANTPNRGCKAG